MDAAGRSRVETVALKAMDGRLQVRTGDDKVKTNPALFDRLAGPTGLTELQNTFDRRAVLRALAQEAQQGARIGALVERGRQFAKRQDVLETRGGELTTAELVAVERRLIAAAQGRASEGVGRVEPEIIDMALRECGRGLNHGQRRAVEATIASGHGVQVIEALAGTGKTYTAGVLRHVYQQAGYEVAGVAPTGRAVRELAEEAGIPSQTLDSLVSSLDRGPGLRAGAVLVLDEAGMAPTRQTAALLAAAQHAGCKVVAIGDPGQLHSVQAGGWMRAVGRKVGTLRLSEVMRQRDPLERQALAALHEGSPRSWLAWAQEHERITVGRGSELIDQVASAWRAATLEHGLGSAVLIARDNDTRRALNERARALVRDQGVLGAERSYGPVQIAVGDRLICRRNDRTVDVDNGTRGTVRAVDPNGVELETGAGPFRQLPSAYVAQHVEHAYALTGHGMQGGTVECAFVVAAPHELTKGWSYTALSRARGETHLFVATDQDQPEREELAPGERGDRLTEKELYARLQRYMKTRDDEDLAIEQLRPAGRHEVELKGGVRSSVLQNAPADRAESPISDSSILAAYQHAREQTEALRMRLEALTSADVNRLEAAERRERQLMAHEDELTGRMQLMPPAPRWSFAVDRQMTERQHLQQAIEAVRLELDCVRSIRDRLVQEVGQPDQIRAERAELERRRSGYEREQHRLLHQLVAHELASDPGWVKSALGERPPARPEGELWDRAARGLARYRLEQGIVDEGNALGNRPSTVDLIERYEQAHATLEDVQRRLGIAAREGSGVEPIRLPRQYLGLLGDARAAQLEAALSVEAKRVCDLPDDELRTLARVQHQALAGLDRTAAAQALRLEREYGHHQQTAQKQTERATELESQASALGWRARHDRDHLRHAATLQHDNAARHLADAERLELELSRLAASGRHPDQWLNENSQRLVTGLAADGELARRRQREVQHHVELAITDPPEHVRELIGERPVSGVRLASEWERLAERIERHRLGYEVDVDRDGALGPDPDLIRREQRGAYTEQRQCLASHVEQYRRMVKLIPHDSSREITREAALDHAREHELR